jgi:KipI family sensor histidine kinase inhibitor
VTGARFTLRPAGPRALLVEFDDLQRVRDYYAEAQRRRVEGTLAAGIEIVPAARTILFDELDDWAEMARDLRSWQPGRAFIAQPRELEIPTVYDGPDLPDVAVMWGVSTDEVIERHVAMRHEVAFVGFAPGFAYIAGLPEELRVPRRARPRTRVPAGSVALADEFTGVYPRESPGGWQLVGRTTVPMWDPAAEPASFLMPGDRVRFVPVRS